MPKARDVSCPSQTAPQHTDKWTALAISAVRGVYKCTKALASRRPLCNSMTSFKLAHHYCSLTHGQSQHGAIPRTTNPPSHGLSTQLSNVGFAQAVSTISTAAHPPDSRPMMKASLLRLTMTLQISEILPAQHVSKPQDPHDHRMSVLSCECKRPRPYWTSA
jgi:hypothetical protein